MLTSAERNYTFGVLYQKVLKHSPPHIEEGRQGWSTIGLTAVVAEAPPLLSTPQPVCTLGEGRLEHCFACSGVCSNEHPSPYSNVFTYFPTTTANFFTTFFPFEASMWASSI